MTPAEARQRQAVSRLLNGLQRFQGSLIDSPIPSRYWAIVAAATLVGALLRFWDLDGVPPGLQQDEAVYGYDAYSIFRTGRDHLGHPFPFISLENFGDWSSPLLTFLSVPAVAVFGLQVESLRAVTALMGTLAIPAIFLLGVLLFQRPSAGAIAACLLALSPLHVHLSRWAVIPSLVPTMLLLTMLAFVWSMRNRNERGFVVAALLAGLTMATYHSMKLYVPLALLPAFLIYRRQILSLRLEALFYAGLIFTIIAGPILYLTLRDPAGGARFSQTSVFEAGEGSLGTVVEQYASYFSPSFWLTSGSNDTMQVPSGLGIELWAVVPLIVCGLVWLVVRAVKAPDGWARSSAVLLLALILLYPVPGSLTIPSPDILRGSHIIPLAALVAGAGAVALTDLVSAFTAPWTRQARAGVAALVIVTFALGFGWDLQQRLSHYFGAYAEEVEPSFHYGLEAALDYAFAHEGGNDEVWVLPDVHSAYIYVLFYKAWPPSDVHRDLSLTRDPPQWNQVHSIGKYRFDEPTSIPWRDFETVFVSHYGSGRPAYEVRTGTSGGKRLLIVHRAD